MLKPSASVVLGSSKSSTGTRPPHYSAARTDVVLLIRRTVRPQGYASSFDSPAALLDERFEPPAGERSGSAALADYRGSCVNKKRGYFDPAPTHARLTAKVRIG